MSVDVGGSIVGKRRRAALCADDASVYVGRVSHRKCVNLELFRKRALTMTPGDARIMAESLLWAARRAEKEDSETTAGNVPPAAQMPPLVEMEVDEDTAKQIELWAAFKGIPDWQVVHWVLAEYVQNHIPPSHGCFH